MGGRTVAFMVVEQPTPASLFWSLVGLALVGWKGTGAARLEGSAAFDDREGVDEVSTSIYPTMSPCITCM